MTSQLSERLIIMTMRMRMTNRSWCQDGTVFTLLFSRNKILNFKKIYFLTMPLLNLHQVHSLKSALRESQDSSDGMELEKVALEEAFKRTIKVKYNCIFERVSVTVIWDISMKPNVPVARRGEGYAGRPGRGPHQQTLRLGEEPAAAQREEAL